MVDYQELTAFVTKIKTEYEQDCNWDGLNTQSFILALSGKVAKYISYWTKLKNLYLKVDEEYNKLYINLYMEYKDGNINRSAPDKICWISSLTPKNKIFDCRLSSIAFFLIAFSNSPVPIKTRIELASNSYMCLNISSKNK